VADPLDPSEEDVALARQMGAEDESAGSAPDGSSPDGVTPSKRADIAPGPTPGSAAEKAASADSADDDVKLALQMKAEQEQERVLEAQMLHYKAVNDKTDPAKRAEVIRLTAASGHPPEEVEQHLEQYRAAAKALTPEDWQRVVYRQPGLARMLDKEPELMPLVKDDAANLRGWEWAHTAPFHAFWDAVNEQRIVGRQFINAAMPQAGFDWAGVDPADNRAGIRDLQKRFSWKDYGDDSFLSTAAIATARMLPFIGLDVFSRSLGGSIGAFIMGGEGAAAGGAATAPAGGEGAVPGAVGGAVAGAAVGQYVGSGVFNYYEALGPAYERFSEMKGADGTPLDPNLAEALAQSTAVASGALMSLGGGALGKSVGFIGKPLFSRLFTSSVEEAMLKPGLAAAMKRGAVEFGKDWLMGATLMGAQSAVNQVAAEAGQTAANQKLNLEDVAKNPSAFALDAASNAHWDKVAGAAGRGWVGGFEDMWLLSLFGTGRHQISEYGRARRSAEDAVRYEALAQSTADSALFRLAPEKFADFIAETAKDPNAPKNVYVPVERWVEYWQGKKADAAQMAAKVMEDGGEGYAKATAAKGDLAIPIEKYFSKFGGTETIKELAPDAKLHADTSTPNQFKAQREADKKELEAKAKARGPEFEADKGEVRKFILDMAVNAGHDRAEASAVAKLVADETGAMALKLNVGVREAANLGSLGRLRILGPKGEKVIAAARERFQRWLRPGAERFLEQRLGSMSTEKRAQEAFLDSVSGLREREVFDRTAVPGGSQVAAITSTDAKGVNDNPAGGHNLTNDLLRSIGVHVGDKAPEASREGTNFLRHVKSQGELDQLLERVRKAHPNVNIEGALGKDSKAALDALDANVYRRRQVAEEGRAAPEPLREGETKLRARGELHPELDVAKLKFGPERAAGAVPKEFVHEISQLTDKEYAERFYVDKVTVDGKAVKTGLLTRKALEALPKKRHAAMLDMRGLKAANIRFGKETGNAMLLAFSDLIAHFGGSSFDATHLSGDEYALQHDDPVELERMVKRLKERAAALRFKHLDAATGTKTPVSVDFRHGIGTDLDSADRDLNARKGKEVGTDHRGPGDGSRDLAPGQQPRGEPGQPQEVERGAGRGRGEEGQVGEAANSGRPGNLGPPDLGGGDGLALEGSGPGPRAGGADLGGVAVSGGGGVSGRGGREGLAAPAPRGRGASRPFQQEVVAHVEGAPVVFSAGEPGKPRGTISLQLDPTGRPRELSIEAFRGDKSTLMHEVTHFLAWSFHDVADSALATPEVKTDYANLLKWAGFKSTNDRLYRAKETQALQAKAERTPSEERKLKQLQAPEERIAHGFEQYLLEGKAPNAGLARVFSKFRGWLMSVYRGLPGIQATFRQNYGEDLGLSNEARDIFARLLGQDDALQQARRDTGDQVEGPQPPPLPTKGMTPAEREAYFAADAAWKASAEQELVQRMNQLQGDQVDEIRGEVTKEVTQDVDRQPVYRAQRYLEHGELVDAGGNKIEDVPDALLNADGSTFKLDRAAFVATFGKDAAAAMPPGIFAAKDLHGLGADTLAPLFGFQDGADMVDAFKAVDPRDRAIAKGVQDKLDETFAPAMEAISKAAMSAVHNEHSAQKTVLELRALARQVNPAAEARVNAIDPRVMKANAERLISESGVGDLDPEQYANNERRAAVEAARLWATDKPAAIEQKVARLFNQMLYRAARDAADKAERVQKKLEATSETIRANLGKADPSYRDLHDEILASVGLGPAPTGEGGTHLDAFTLKAGEEGFDAPSAFDVDGLRKALEAGHDWDQLSVAEAENVSDAVQFIRHIARATNTIEIKGKRLAVDAYVKALGDRAAAVQRPQPKMPYSQTAEGIAEKGRRLRRGAQATLEDMETWAEMLDGGTEGPAHDLLIHARIDCRTHENELNARVLKVIKEKWDNVPKDIRKLKDRLVDVKELLPVPANSGTLEPVYTRDTLWRLFMAYGSDGNRQRLNDGNGWSNENIEKALSLLSRPELEFLQGVKDSINSLYEDLAKAYEKRTGLKLGKVDALPVTVNGATYDGGYDPIRYDSRLSSQGQKQEVSSVKDLFGGQYQKPTLPNGHTKSRVEKVDAPLDLTWGMVPAHLSQVIRDISHGDWVRQVGSIMLAKGSAEQPSFRDITVKYLGEERAKEFIPWLRDVANARADSAAGHQSDFMRRVGSWTRSKLSLAVMGLNLPSLMRHTFDPWSTLADSEAVGPQHIVGAYLKVMNPANWGALPEFGQSKELANHEAKLNDNLREELTRIGPGSNGTITQAITTVAFKAHELVHHFTARVVFKAAYDQAIAQGKTAAEAVQRGDDVTRRALPSGDVAEKPPILRTKQGWASAVMFYGYASKMHNLRARAFDAAARTWQSPTSTPASKMEAIATVAGKIMAVGAVAALGSYFSGRGWKRDEDSPEGAAKWAAGEVLLDPIEGIPILGPATKAIATGHQVNIANAPELALVEQIFTGIQRGISKAQSSGSKSDADRVWAAVEVLLSMTGATGFVRREVGNVNAQRKGEFRPRGPLDAASGAFYGAPKADGSSSVTPLQHAQDALDTLNS
jgi:GGDEF domain-containing protein